MNGHTLNELIEIAEQAARRWLIGGKKAWPPTILLDTPAGLQIVVTELADLPALRTLIKDRRAVAYCICHEAWAASVRGLDEFRAIDEGRAPNASARPDRFEVVAVFATDGMSQKSRCLAIRRDASGDCVALDNESIGEEPALGRFTTLLDARA